MNHLSAFSLPGRFLYVPQVLFDTVPCNNVEGSGTSGAPLLLWYGSSAGGTQDIVWNSCLPTAAPGPNTNASNSSPSFWLKEKRGSGPRYFFSFLHPAPSPCFFSYSYSFFSSAHKIPWVAYLPGAIWLKVIRDDTPQLGSAISRTGWYDSPCALLLL